MLSVNMIGQFTDNFGDGNFSSNPSWTGSDALFSINSSGQLQTISTVAGQAYLNTSFSNVNLDNKEWNLFVRQTFAGSDNNQSRVYLVSNGPVVSYTGNGSAGVQGYFLKFGEGGSSDAIKFFRDNGVDPPIEVATCTSGAISSSFSSRLRITRNNLGLWTIFVDYSGGNTFIQEASFNESTFLSSNNFGLICTYTVSNADNFFFDDFYFGDIIVDNTPPEISSVTATSTSSIDIVFNEPIEEGSAETLSNYLLNGVQNPTSAQLSSTNNALVSLTFSPSFLANTTQILEISNVADINANSIIPTNFEFSFFVPATPSFRSVVFNEVLADPTPSIGLPEFEFVEIFNPTSETFNLSNWQFVNSTTAKVLPNLNMAPGQFYVLCDASAAANFQNAIPITSLAALTNSGDSLTLIDNSGNIIDILVYSDDWFDTPEKLNGGWTLEQINPSFPCSSSSNWQESQNSDGGTPSVVNSVFNSTPDTTPPTITSSSVTNSSLIQINFSETMSSDDPGSFVVTANPNIDVSSIIWNDDFTSLFIQLVTPLQTGTSYSLVINGPNDCSGNSNSPYNIEVLIGFMPEPGDLIINEILADPDPPVSGAIQLAEFIEIYNKSNKILDLTGLKVNSGTIIGSPILQPDSYIVLTSTSNIDFFNSISNSIAVTSFPGLTNTGTTIVLSHPSSGTLDIVSYEISWYNDEEKEDGGYSLELINPDFPCPSSSNWAASISATGNTPGTVNSVFNNTVDSTAPFVQSIEGESPTSLLVIFNETMNNTLPDGNDFLINPSLDIANSLWLPESNAIQFFLNENWEPGINYEISLANFSDCSGNTLNDTTIQFIQGFQPEAGDLIISEIMAAPSQTINVYRAEFFEIYNRSNKLIDLSQVTINDQSLGNSYALASGEYITIADDGAETILNNISDILFMPSFPSLSNTGDTIFISHPDAGILDLVGYTDEWYKDVSKDAGGWSLELINPNDPCSTADNWKASLAAAGATPSTPNSVLDLTPDTSGPILLSVYSGLFGPVSLVFNEPVTDETLSTFSWQVNGQSSTPNFIEFGNSDRTIIRVGVPMIISGQVYTFTIDQVADCWGNVSQNISGWYAGPESPSPGDLIINEVLSNPYEEGFDFVEIYNRSNKIISLSSWLMATEDNGVIEGAEIITDFGYNLRPDEYLVLTENGSELPGFYPFTQSDRILKVEDLPSYNNSSGIVILQLPTGEVSDRFEYEESMHFPLIEDLDGVSLERIDPNRPASDATNWSSAAASQGYATPGYQNSQALAAVFGDDDITISPEIFSPDNDGFNDVVTITYQNLDPTLIANIYIYDAAGRPVKHLTKSELLGVNGAISWNGTNEDNLISSVGVYIVYFEVFSSNGNTSRFKKTVVLAQRLD